MMAQRYVRPGQFVYTPDRNRIGKVLRTVGDEAIVRLTHSAVLMEEESYLLSDLDRAFLYPEMRVFYEHEETGIVRAGRVRDYFRDGDLMSYLIRFPNGAELELAEEKLETRTLLPNPDPTDALAAGYSETQFFYDRRMAAQTVLMHARQHSRGLTGLLSASVELLPHQVAVVWRVLSDPIQRYLLADEVGMGKTIEAGAILRQILLDDPKARVVVAAPVTLVQQWQRELTMKFHLEEFGTRWRVVPFSALATLAAAEVDALVLDEAHHLVAPRPGQEQLSQGLLTRLAHAVPRLFLLTATPVLGDPMATLRLLHLLDPQVYPIEDIDGFTQKLAKREEYGSLLISIMPGLTGFPLKRLVNSLIATFGDDPMVGDFAEQLRQPGLTQEQTDDVIRALKRYLMETYRLHQRLVRTRRADLQGWEMLPREGEVRAESDASLDDMEILASALEDWRDAAQCVASEAGNAVEGALAERYVLLFESLGEGIESFARAIAHQRAAIERGEVASFPDDLAYLDRMAQPIAELSDPTSKLDGLVQIVKRFERTIARPITGAVKSVLFTTSAEAARSTSLHLVRAFGEKAIVTVLTGDQPLAVEEAVHRFEDGRKPMVLVADRSGEEGLNLQCADAIIHLDLPLDPARLEQRVGRVDRFGRKEAGVPQAILLPTDEDGSPWEAWRFLLEKAFQLFASSLSDVQFQLEAMQAELALRLFRVGADGLMRSEQWVSTELAQERQRLEAQHALDQLVLTDDHLVPLYEALEAGDRSDEYEDLNRWLVETLHFERRSVTPGEPDPFLFRWGKQTLMSKWPWEESFKRVLEQPHTYQREVARANPSTRLLRPGAHLVTVLEKVIRWEDRGSSFATWRVDKRWPTADHGEWLGLRLTYVVEFNLGAALALMAVRPDRATRAAIRRRADALFAPWLHTVTLDASLVVVTDPMVEEILAAPYRAADRGGNDYNLGSRRDDLYRVVDPGQFQRICRDVRKRSNKLIQESRSFQERVEEALRQAQIELGASTQMLQYRQRQFERQTGRPDPTIEEELGVNMILMESLSSPRIRLDAIGCFVISSQAPVQGRGN